jgi:hypothetical protein
MKQQSHTSYYFSSKRKPALLLYTAISETIS